MSPRLHLGTRAVDRLLPLLVRGLLSLAHVAPVPLWLRLGETLGSWSSSLLRPFSRVALSHVRAQARLPSSPSLVPACFGHLGRSAAELSLLVVGRFDLDRQVKVYNPLVLDEILSSPGPVMWISGHLGNWEMAAAWLATRGVPLHALAVPLKAPRLDQLVRELRGRAGISTLATDRRGLAAAMRLLHRGGHLGILLDHRCPGRGVEVPFLGRPAWTPTAAARLAQRYRARVVVAASRRCADGSHEVRMTRMDPQPGEDTATLTARWTCGLEGFLVEAPSQWVWMQPRWKEGRG